MAMNTSGQALSDDERAEFLAYSNRGMTQPDKFDGVVAENVGPAGMTYRYANADEAKASKASADAAAKAAEANAALNDRITAANAKQRGVVAPPEKPAGA